MSLRLLFLAGSAAALIGAGCGGGGGSSPSTATVSVISDFAPETRTVPGYADSLVVTITPPAGINLPVGTQNPFTLTRAATKRLLAGLAASPLPYRFDMQALTDGVVVGTAVRSIVLQPGVVREIDVSANLESGIASVTIEGAETTSIGTQRTYTAYARDSMGAVLFSGSGFEFVSSNPGVLEIGSDTGIANAKSMGEATLTATLLGTSLTGQAGVEVLERIAFNSDRDGDFEVFTMETDGSDPIQLTHNTAADTSPSYSGDGSLIAFESTRDGNSEIYLMEADGSNQTRLTMNAAGDFHPCISGDGSKIVFTSARTGNWDVFIMNADGTGLTQLTNNPANDWQPTINRDGTRVTFSSLRDGNWEVYMMNSDGTGQQRVTNSGAEDSAPAFNPGMSKIAWAPLSAGNREIFIMNLDGTGALNLSSTPEVEDVPCFDGDGNRIVFSSFRTGNAEIFIMSSDGSGQTNLTNSSAHDNDPTMPQGCT